MDGIVLQIQDGGALERKSRPCWKTAHQPQRRTEIGLTDFHGDTIVKKIDKILTVSGHDED